LIQKRARDSSQHTHITITALLGAAQAYGHGAYHDVVDEITRKLVVTPDDAALRFKLACAHQEHGEWKQALVECERVRRLSPQAFEIAFIEGMALTDGGLCEAAKGVLDAFLVQKPSHAKALAQRGRVHWRLGKAVETKNDFEAALRLDPRAPASWWLEAAQAGDAVLVLRRALLAHADDPELLTASLDAELKAGNTDEALRRVDSLQKAAPRPEPWMARRAELLQAAGRAADARAAWAALQAHLSSLPNLERGTPLLAGVLAKTQQALGIAAPVPVIAPPASPHSRRP
jgi:tetratricopeptide (TPR) repeat protein